MLILEKVSKSFYNAKKEVPLFSDISITFLPDASYAITGTSGIGKSTLLSLIASFDVPSSGTIYWQDKNINTFSEKQLVKLRSHHIGFLFQKPYLFNEISVLENSMLPALIAGKNKKEATVHTEHLLDTLGILEKKDMQPNLLSGGEQQRVALARALSNKPSYLLADEPTAFLDEKTSDIIINFIDDYAEKNNMGLILVSHDPKIVEFCDHHLHLENQMLITK